MKTRKTNYNGILRKINQVYTKIKSNDLPIIIIADQLKDGRWKIAQTTKDYKRTDFIIDTSEEFENYLKTISGIDCTVIIDDEFEKFSDDLITKVTKECTNEELKSIIAGENDEQIIKEKVKKIIGDERNEIN